MKVGRFRQSLHPTAPMFSMRSLEIGSEKRTNSMELFETGRLRREQGPNDKYKYLHEVDWRCGGVEQSLDKLTL